DTYLDHLRVSQLRFKYGAFETLLVMGANVVQGLTLIGLPKAVKNLLEFRKRELQLREDELRAPGRELAYIVHANRQFGS
ncbi:MAG: hypothetical protein V3T82_09710, partial [Nitrospinaceae bacterium]